MNCPETVNLVPRVLILALAKEDPGYEVAKLQLRITPNNHSISQVKDIENIFMSWFCYLWNIFEKNEVKLLIAGFPPCMP
jgi:hypothetical protein